MAYIVLGCDSNGVNDAEGGCRGWLEHCHFRVQHREVNLVVFGAGDNQEGDPHLRTAAENIAQLIFRFAVKRFNRHAQNHKLVFFNRPLRL